MILDWGSVHYLRESSVTLDFAADSQHDDHVPGKLEARRLTVYGSPWTPQYGISAFQHPREQDIWTDSIPLNCGDCYYTWTTAFTPGHS